MIARNPTAAETWLLSLPPTRRQTRWVIAIAISQVAALALLAPFAKTPLARFDSFIPAFEGVIFVTDLVTSVLLFSQFAIYRLRALLVLACGFLLSALIIIPHALTFPGAFSPTGLLGAGLQSTAWLYWFWHLVFLLALLGYGLLKDERPESGPAQVSSLAVIVRSVALVLVLAFGLTLLATAGNDYLPALFADRVGSDTPATHAMGVIAALVCVSTLAVLWIRRRSLLDQWLLIVALSAVLEIGLVVIFSPARFTLGYYAGRLFSLLTSTVVLVVLLAETTRLYEQRVKAETRERLQIWNVSQDLLLIADLEGKYVSVNPAWTATLGWLEADLLGKSSQWLRHPEDREKTRAEIDQLSRGHKTLHFENRLRAKDGSYHSISWAAAPDGGRIYGTGRDITEQKRAEESLRELELDLAHMNRVSVMGELAASLSHEITQPIASARNNARAALNFLDKKPSDLSEVKEALCCIVGDANRAGNIVDRIRDHIKKAPARKDYFDLNAAIGEVIELARSAIIRNGVSAQTRLADGLSPVHGDRVQLQQVVLNLILNAVEAMGSVGEGSRDLLISTEQDHDVLVTVHDSGPGIVSENLERVFDAFYTTKSSGVGMGLSICRSIISAHGGRLWVEANEPRGAVFQFTLPAA
jgi:PAS domain S-box-containing protein